MSLATEVIQQIIDLKQEDEINRENPKFKGLLLSNRDVAEQVLGNRKAESTVRRVWKKYKSHGHYNGAIGSAPVADGYVESPVHFRKQLTGKKFVVTSAQNNTLIHEDFYKSLIHYCEAEGAELVVSPFYYNKQGTRYGKKDTAWFDKRIQPYLLDESVELADGLVFCAELNILPTAVNPISGLHNYTGDSSGIIPHAKLQLESVPTHKKDMTKLMYTTGTVTQRNYRQEKSGQKADWTHSFSALVVEVDEEGDWFVRQLHAESDTGCFYDLGWYYTPNGKEPIQHMLSGIQFGDVHVEKLREDVANVCWGLDNPNSIANYLSPEYIFLHDTLDFSRRSHHNVKDPYFMFQQMVKGKECVREEVYNTLKVMHDVTKVCDNVIVVESNHDLALERFLKEQDYRRDPVNALFFLELQLENYRAMERGENLRTFETACKLVADENFDLSKLRFLTTDEPFRLHGIECGQHGDRGANGSRGSINAFVKMGIKYNIGHSHSCNIRDGVYQAGAMELVEDAGYAKGGSSWTVSHILIYPNGKRCIVTQKGLKWRSQ